MPNMFSGESLTRLIQGLVAGAVITAVLGFGFGGWQLQSKALKAANDTASKAVVAVLAPICADKFQRAPNAKETLATLKATDSRKQDTFVSEGGWATFPGNAEPNRNVAEACAKMLNELK